MSSSMRNVDYMRAFFQSCKGFNPQHRMDFYNSWAETYEQDSEIIRYRAPQQVVDFLNDHFCGNREEVQVLDVACGSGLAAKLMLERGFRHFVGVDGSKGMLEQAAKTSLYRDLKLALLGTDPLPAETGGFDVVMIIGALRDGFVPVSVIRELCNATKPGGYVCMSRVDPKSESGDKYKVSMEQELQLMVEEGLWTLVDTKELNRYMLDVYNDKSKKEEDEEYLHGTMYLYRKSLNKLKI